MRGRGNQLALPLGVTEVPESALRAAFERCRIGLSFEEAIKQPMYQLCLRNVVIAQTIKKRRRK